MSEWISAEDQFPTEGKDVLIFIEYKKDNSTFREIRIGSSEEEYSYEEDKNYIKQWQLFPCDCGTPTEFEVLYWMPLPKSPENK